MGYYADIEIEKEINKYTKNFKQKTKFKCDVCGKILGNNKSLAQHKHDKHGDVSTQCPYCKCMPFGSINDLNRHIESKHNIKG